MLLDDAFSFVVNEAYNFQYSIGDALSPWPRASPNVRDVYFQYSIGDALKAALTQPPGSLIHVTFNTPLEMQINPLGLKSSYRISFPFQYSIGDALLEACREELDEDPTHLSILHWRCGVGVA